MLFRSSLCLLFLFMVSCLSLSNAFAAEAKGTDINHIGAWVGSQLNGVKYREVESVAFFARSKDSYFTNTVFPPLEGVYAYQVSSLVKGNWTNPVSVLPLTEHSYPKLATAFKISGVDQSGKFVAMPCPFPLDIFFEGSKTDFKAEMKVVPHEREPTNHEKVMEDRNNIVEKLPSGFLIPTQKTLPSDFKKVAEHLHKLSYEMTFLKEVERKQTVVMISQRSESCDTFSKEPVTPNEKKEDFTFKGMSGYVSAGENINIYWNDNDKCLLISMSKDFTNNVTTSDAINMIGTMTRSQ